MLLNVPGGRKSAGRQDQMLSPPSLLAATARPVADLVMRAYSPRCTDKPGILPTAANRGDRHPYRDAVGAAGVTVF